MRTRPDAWRRVSSRRRAGSPNRGAVVVLCCFPMPGTLSHSRPARRHADPKNGFEQHGGRPPCHCEVALRARVVPQPRSKLRATPWDVSRAGPVGPRNAPAVSRPRCVPAVASAPDVSAMSSRELVFERGWQEQAAEGSRPSTRMPQDVSNRSLVKRTRCRFSNGFCKNKLQSEFFVPRPFWSERGQRQRCSRRKAGAPPPGHRRDASGRLPGTTPPRPAKTRHHHDTTGAPTGRHRSTTKIPSGDHRDTPGANWPTLDPTWSKIGNTGQNLVQHCQTLDCCSNFDNKSDPFLSHLNKTMVAV